MNYEKAYKEALEIAREIHNGNPSSGTAITVYEQIFPKLKDSKDEKIRKSLITLLQHFCKGYCVPGLAFSVSYKDMLAWIEKQGKNNTGISEATKKELEDNLNKALEKETPESWNEFLDEQGEKKTVVIPRFREGDIIKLKYTGEIFEVSKIEVYDADEIYYYLTNGGCVCENVDNFERVEQKPVESNKEFEDFVRWFVKQRTDDYTLIPSDEDIHKWAVMILKHAKKCINEQKSVWSKEDIKTMCQIFRIVKDSGCSNRCYNRIAKFLNNITQNPKNHWKPSDQELAAILTVIGDEKQKGSDVVKELRNIYQQLKKLREE